MEVGISLRVIHGTDSGHSLDKVTLTAYKCLYDRNVTENVSRDSVCSTLLPLVPFFQPAIPELEPQTL